MIFHAKIIISLSIIMVLINMMRKLRVWMFLFSLGPALFELKEIIPVTVVSRLLLLFLHLLSEEVL